MSSDDIIEAYENSKLEYGENAFEHVSDTLKEYKKTRKKNWEQNPGKVKDFEQSWKPTKGKALERLIFYILEDEVKKLNLKIFYGHTLERTKLKNLSYELEQVKRHLFIDYGEFGTCLPDADLIVYDPQTNLPVVIISSKTTLRERIAQTAYWKFKLNETHSTRYIKMFFVTPDDDSDLSKPSEDNKPRMIVEVELDGSYVLSDNVLESKKVKKFSELIHDLRKLVNGNKR